LAHSAEQLANAPEIHHAHIDDAAFRRETTLSVCTAGNLSLFDRESRQIIGLDDDG
jgi:hypothetical protein